MNPKLEDIQIRLRKLLELEGVKQGTKKAATIEWALLHGVSLAMGISFPQYLILIMASGRSILNEKS
jgi:hypothetical protein